MANLFMAGFDDHDAAGLAYEWRVGGSPTIVAGGTGNCVRLSATTAHSVYLVKSVGVATASLVVGFRYRLSSLAGTSLDVVLELGDGSRPHLVLRQNADGTLAIYRPAVSNTLSFATTAAILLATSSNSIAINTFYYVELAVTIGDSPNGSIALAVNGSTTGWIPTTTSLDTQNSGTALVSYVGWCNGSASSVAFDYDDIYMNDTTGSVCNGMLGDVRVDCHLPTTDGANSDWTPSTGTDHYATIDENPPNTTDYNSTLTLNAVDTVSVEAFKNDGADIFALQVNLLASKSDAGTCGLQAVIRESGVDTPSGVSTYPSTSWQYMRANYSLAVGDAKRAAAGFDAAEYGYSKVV
jgi:hypothetical protein